MRVPLFHVLPNTEDYNRTQRLHDIIVSLSSYLIYKKPEKCDWYSKEKTIKRHQPWDFPGGAVVESLPADAGDVGSSPGPGRSHRPWSSWAPEPQLLSLRVWSLCSATREATTVRGPRTAMKSGPHSPQLEKALAQKLRPNTAKNK